MSTRIIKGFLKGRELKTVEGKAVRPTSGFLRKVIFDTMGYNFSDAKVLDLFAGTGTLGIECIGLGASYCTFIEKDKNAATILKENLTKFKIKELSKVWVGDVLRFVKKYKHDYDYVFVDPPYPIIDIIREIDFNSIVKTGGWLIVQHSRKDDIDSMLNMKSVKKKIHGSSGITFFSM